MPLTTPPLRPIRTKRDYEAALARVDTLWNAPAKSPEADALDVLTLLIADYEAKPSPDPIDFLTHVMESRGLARKDLEPFIGSRGRVSEILSRTRPLSLTMIRNLTAGLRLPADVLVKQYPLAA
jgi:HTH-type transcriptional regulator / antitoxin HigA